MNKPRHRQLALVSSIILGLIWFCWHLPLFFVNGTTQKRWGFGSIGLFGFLLFLMASTLIMTWAYNRNGKSLLSAVLIHCVSNLVLDLVPLSGEGLFIQGAILAIVAVPFVHFSGSKGPAAREQHDCAQPDGTSRRPQHPALPGRPGIA